VTAAPDGIHVHPQQIVVKVKTCIHEPDSNIFTIDVLLMECPVANRIQRGHNAGSVFTERPMRSEESCPGAWGAASDAHECPSVMNDVPEPCLK
jgi:hypothetical protein